MELNDSLGKLDLSLEGILRKIDKQVHDIDSSVHLKIEVADGQSK
jgi:hypothetical protein